MPTVRLAKILKDNGTKSVRQLCQSTGIMEKSVFKQAQIAALRSYYRKNDGYRGPFGFPLSEAEFAGKSAGQDYSGGKIKFLSDTPEGEKMTAVRVRFVGFHCDQESDWDQASGSDEPYFLISVVSAKGSKTMRFGPYADIDSGTVRLEASYIASDSDEITPSIVLGVIAMEHDHGTPEEAEAKVRKVIVELEKKFDEAASVVAGTSAGSSHVLPEWTRDILIGWLPEGIAAVFGMGDDEIGKTPMVLFDNKKDLKEWNAPAVKGKHGPNDYNIILPIDGGSQGEYSLYFMVDLFDITKEVKPHLKN